MAWKENSKNARFDKARRDAAPKILSKLFATRPFNRILTKQCGEKKMTLCRKNLPQCRKLVHSGVCDARSCSV